MPAATAAGPTTTAFAGASNTTTTAAGGAVVAVAGPGAAVASPALAACPYLGRGYEFVERAPGSGVTFDGASSAK